MNILPSQQQPRPSLITTVNHHVGNFFNYLTSLRKGYKSGSANAIPTNAIPTGGKKTRRNRRSKNSKHSKHSKRNRTRKHNKTKKRKH